MSRRDVSHKHVQQNLADYLEGDLGLDDRALVDAHLDQCVECAREVVEMQQTIRLLRLTPEPETPPMIAANVMRRIRAGETHQSWFSRASGALGRIFEPSFVLPASAVAAAALVVVVVQGPSSVVGDGMALAPSGSARVASLDALTPSLGRGSQREPRAIATPVRTRQPMRASGRAVALDSTATNPTPAFALNAASRAAGNTVATPVGIGARESSPVDRTASARPALRGSPNPLSPSLSSALSPSLAYREPARDSSTFAAPGASLDPTERLAELLAGNRGASATLVGGRFSAASGPAGARTVSRSFPSAGLASGLAPRLDLGAAADVGGSSGGDPRDAWLDRGLRDPIHFARFLGEKSLAEQELWVGRLAARAVDRGVLESLVLVLQASGDDAAIWLASDFAAEAKRARSASESSGER